MRKYFILFFKWATIMNTSSYLQIYKFSFIFKKLNQEKLLSNSCFIYKVDSDLPENWCLLGNLRFNLGIWSILKPGTFLCLCIFIFLNTNMAFFLIKLFRFVYSFSLINLDILYKISNYYFGCFYWEIKWYWARKRVKRTPRSVLQCTYCTNAFKLLYYDMFFTLHFSLLTISLVSSVFFFCILLFISAIEIYATSLLDLNIFSIYFMYV